MGRTAAMILAGGQGKRMGILCNQTPKPALPFGGKFRVMDFSLSNCLQSGIDNIAAVTDYQQSSMADYLTRWSSENARSNRSELSILEPRNGHYLGTADAVYQNLLYLIDNQVETVLVLAADHIYKMDYQELLTFHSAEQADVTVGVLPVELKDAVRFGSVKLDAENRILDFAEKAASPLSNLVSMGIYAFRVPALFRRLQEDAGMLGSAHDFGYSIIPGMVRKDKAFAFRFNGYWRDIGTTEAYYAANMDYLHQGPSNGSLEILPTFGDGKAQSGALKAYSGEKIRNSLISPGCLIRGVVENSILSPGVVVEEHAVVKNSILMDNVFIADHSRVESAIIGKRANVSRYCRIGEPDSFQGSKVVAVVGEDAVVLPGREGIEMQVAAAY
jgi:glucose-1-phosphate adenylyltransferase